MFISFVECRPSPCGLWKSACLKERNGEERIDLKVCVQNLVMYRFLIKHDQIMEWKDNRLVAKGITNVSTLRKEYPESPWPPPFYSPETGTWTLTIEPDGSATVEGVSVEIGEFVSIKD